LLGASALLFQLLAIPLDCGPRLLDFGALLFELDASLLGFGALLVESVPLPLDFGALVFEVGALLLKGGELRFGLVGLPFGLCPLASDALLIARDLASALLQSPCAFLQEAR
jgi:hypothetical protein